jgi:hypothetical protein
LKAFSATLGVTAILSLLVSFCGCRQKVDAPAAAETRTWSWAEFPEAEELLLAQLPATVQPRRVELVRAPASGVLRLEASFGRDGVVQAGQRWGVIQSDDQGEHDAALGRLEQKIEERRKRYREFEQPFAASRLAHEIVDLEETLELARLAERSPELFAGDEPTLEPHLRPTTSGAQLTQQLEVLRQRYQQLEAQAPEAEPADLQALVAELEQRRDLEMQRRARLALKTNFSGRLTLMFDVTASERHVEVGEVIGRLEDDSAFEVRVSGSLPLLHAMPAENLTVRVVLPGGRALSAESAKPGIELRAEGPAPVLRFEVPGALDSRPPAEVQLPALVHVRLPRAARIVPKLALVQHDTAGVLSEGWRAGLPRLLPGSELLAEGRNAVALLPGK